MCMSVILYIDPLFIRKLTNTLSVRFSLCLPPLKDNVIHLTQETNSAKNMYVWGNRKIKANTSM